MDVEYKFLQYHCVKCTMHHRYTSELADWLTLTEGRVTVSGCVNKEIKGECCHKGVALTLPSQTK